MEEWQKLARLRRKERLIVFLQCGKSKRPGLHPAAELYTGTYFVSSLGLAKRLAADNSIFVLSAKYGILRLDQTVRSYNIKLSDLDDNALMLWRRKVRCFIHQKRREGFTPLFLCGRLYYDGLDGVKPVPSKGIGFQLQWFKRMIVHSWEGNF